MNESDIIRLRHMLDAAREALSFVAGRNSEDLGRDRMLVLALVKEIEIIGEAASRPFTTAGRSIRESFQAGQVRAWRSSDSSPSSANPTPPRAKASPISPGSAAQAVHTARSSIPPENSGGPGMAAPIRPES